ncbi:MAG: sigma-54-dependent Fis family transcriptional regulator [Verrucomicrobiales bacterium]|nr:sigma-54-dependent Fis family transcriptional regulator [Verrucomicrobiales bacterium]
MTTIWHPPGLEPKVAPRLRKNGFGVGPWPVDRLPNLDSGTSNQVFVVPEAAIRSPGWPALRVHLSRSGRLFLVELDSVNTAAVVEAMRDGAFDVLDAGESRWAEAVNSAVDNQKLWLRLYAGQLPESDGRMVGRSSTFQQLQRDLERLGPTDVTVLLLGESGVGKERFAAALHAAGRGGPMVSLNCAALPKDLLEAELFGAEKGAFTGALRSRPGLVEQASGGTLFLDEVGEMDLSVQPKLLRFLETRRARRIGGDREYSVSIRVVSATNRDLEADVRSGRFRADLFYRLAEVTLRIPPLRERADDIPLLAQTFVGAASERFGKNVERLEPGLVLKLKSYAWPGNVRELKSVVDRLVLFHDGPVLREGWWDPPMASPPVEPAAEVAARPSTPVPGSAAPGGMPSRSDRVAYARQLIRENGLSLTEVAARSGIHPTTLFRWRKSGKL